MKRRRGGGEAGTSVRRDSILLHVTRILAHLLLDLLRRLSALLIPAALFSASSVVVVFYRRDTKLEGANLCFFVFCGFPVVEVDASRETESNYKESLAMQRRHSSCASAICSERIQIRERGQRD